MPPEVQKITGSEIEGLKESSLKQQDVKVQLRQRVAGLFSSMASGVAGMFARPEKRKTQCDLYGHMLPASGWAGDFPSCIECGTRITSQEMVRRATTGQHSPDIKPYDNRLGQ